MSTTQGERKQSIRSTVIAGAVAIVVAIGGVVGVSVGLDNARAQAAQLHLLAGAKTDSITMQAATTEDAAVMADATQAEAIAHTDQLAAQAEAGKVAAEKAAAAKVAAAAAAQAAALAAQQTAQQQTVQSAPQQQQAAPSAPALIKCPAGSQATAGDQGNDTACLPVICFHINLPDPAHPECATPFKP